MGVFAGITLAGLSQAPPGRPNALEAMEQASHALRHRRKLPAGFALQGRVTANAAAATPSAPRASRAFLRAAPYVSTPFRHRRQRRPIALPNECGRVDGISLRRPCCSHGNSDPADLR